ncbi:hypothetical protein PMAYCL1PPCAC_00574, partial [Pristionchus mayeri]
SEKSKDNLRIFIKYEHDENVQGPYNERQLLEMCMQKDVDDSTPFCFMKEGEEPDRHETPFFTYAQRSKEKGAPFSFNDAVPFEKRQIKEEHIEEVQESVQEDQGIQTIKEGVKKLPVKSDCFRTTAYANVYLSVCDYFRTVNNLSISAIAHCSRYERLFSNLNNDQKQLVLNDLTLQMNLVPYLFCSICERFMFTAFDTFMHMASPKHIEKTNKTSETFVKANDLMSLMVQRLNVQKMLQVQSSKANDHRKKYDSMNMEDKKKYRSMGDELDEVKRDRSQVKRCYRNKESHEVTDIWMKQLYKDNALLMELLNDKIRDAKTRCTSCDLMFEKVAEYYTHLSTFYHLHHMTKPFDIITLVVNIQNYKKSRSQVWSSWSELPYQSPEAAVAKDEEQELKFLDQPPIQESGAPVAQKDENPESREPNQPPKEEAEEITANKEKQSADGGNNGETSG